MYFDVINRKAFDEYDIDRPTQAYTSCKKQLEDLDQELGWPLNDLPNEEIYGPAK